MDNEIQPSDSNDTLGNVPQAVEVATKRRPGRPPLPPEERLRRRTEQKQRYAVRNEARRRALVRLQKRHEEEYEALFIDELSTLASR